MQRNVIPSGVRRCALWLALGVPSFAALPYNTIWEARIYVGNDTTAGGCFVSTGTGTDYSQQNAAQYSASDLVVSGTSVTSASHSFVAADVGNCIHITAGSGLTAGFYEIVSVLTGTATLDRSAGTGSAGTYYVGGALATPAQANANATASNTIWVKATGPYTVTSAMTVSLSSGPVTSVTPGTPLSFIGYTSTRGDNGQVTWTTAQNTTNLVDFSGGNSGTGANNVLFQNFIFTNTASTKGYGLIARTAGNAFSIYTYNDSFSGFVDAINGNLAGGFFCIQGLYVVNTRITASSSYGIVNSCTTIIKYSKIDANGSDGATWATGSPYAQSSFWQVDHSIFYDNANNGINNTLTNTGGNTQPGLTVDFCDFSTNGLNGIALGSVIDPTALISNSIFDANGGYGVSVATGVATPPFLGPGNAFYNNTSGQVNQITQLAGTSRITLTASPYVSVGTNFALNSTAGGGAALYSAGFPGVMPGGTGYAAVGALQPAASSGGGQHGYPIVQ